MLRVQWCSLALQVVFVGGYDDYAEESAAEFANMKTTSNSDVNESVCASALLRQSFRPNSELDEHRRKALGLVPTLALASWRVTAQVRRS